MFVTLAINPFGYSDIYNSANSQYVVVFTGGLLCFILIVGKAIKTKHRVRDLDEITEDLKPQNVRSMIRQRIDYDLPGAGQNYCVHCAKHFISDKALKEHLGSRPHKRR